jgi:Dienelactone hydrolase family
LKERHSGLQVQAMQIRILAAFLIMTALSARAEIVSRPVDYRQGGTVLEGWSVYDDAIQGKRPAVLVVHQWKGLGEYEKKRAEMLARLGYNVFAADIYGKGVRPQTPQAAGAEAGKFKNNRPCCGQGSAPGWMCSGTMNSPTPTALPPSATVSAGPPFWN